MELKDVILSTLDELEQTKFQDNEKKETTQVNTILQTKEKTQPQSNALNSSEEVFLSNTKERIHVLFEGFQSPNNSKIEAKVDLTLNFLEFLLGTIEARIKEIKKWSNTEY